MCVAAANDAGARWATVWRSVATRASKGEASGESPGIVAGAYLSGKKAVMIMENSGLRQALEPIARFAYCHAMPMVMVMCYRGYFGERNWWGHNHAQTMGPILDAIRIPWRVVRKVEDIKSSIKKAIQHADSSQWPVALVMSGECVETPYYGKD